MPDFEIPPLPPRPFWVPAFLDPPDFEIEIQVEEYRTLPWHRSYRKMSCILLALQAILGTALTLMIRGTGALLGTLLIAVVYSVLAILVGLGRKGAMTVAVALFTADRILGAVGSFVNPLALGLGLAWWLFFMERFWKAIRIEQTRTLVSRSQTAATAKAAAP